MKSNYKKLGDYIRLVDERNTDGSVTRLLGVSIEKKFIESIANTIGTDMSIYKIVRKGQFAYGPVTSRNGDKVSIALLEEEKCIISSSYSVFEIINTKELLPEYLNLWFKRPEFDRYARFHSHGSAREIFDWEEMCNVELPVPEIEEQRKIVEAYNTIEKRIALKRKINDNLEAQMEALSDEHVVNAEAFDYNESLDENIDFINGLAMQNFRPKCNDDAIPVIKIRELTQGYCDNNSEYCSKSIDETHIIRNGDLVFSWSGSLQAAFWTSQTAGLNQHLFKVQSNKYPMWFVYRWVIHHLLSFKRIAENKGTTFGHIKREDLHAAKIKSLNNEKLDILNRVFTPLLKAIVRNATELHSLMELQSVLLAQLSR